LDILQDVVAYRNTQAEPRCPALRLCATLARFDYVRVFG
jgi:hypothetical protein